MPASRLARLAVPAGLIVSAAFSTAFISRASFLIDGRRYFSLFDDAMISMRYGRILAEGHGLVWNAGEPRVEGYTNFLWTIWMAALHLAPLPDRFMPLAVSASGALLLVLCVVFTVRLVRRLAPDAHDAGPLIGGLAVACCYPLIFWTLRGMEVGFLAALVLLAADLACGIAARERERLWPLATVLALLPLTRPDGIVPALAVGAWTFWRVPAERRRRAAAVLVAPVAALAIHTLFRWQYYGAPLPNTYYLKMAGVPLIERLGRGLATAPYGIRFLVGPLAIAAAGGRVRRKPEALLVLGVPLLLVSYGIYVGGDAWEWMPVANRYITPGLPLLLAAGAAALATEAPRRVGRRRVLLLAIGGILLAAGPSYYGIADWIRTRGSHVQDDALNAEFAVRLKESTSEQTRVAVVWGGVVPYFSRRPAIDLLGKSDPVIARHPPVLPFFPGHDRFDYDYSIGVLRPDVVVGVWSPTPHVLQLLADMDYERAFGMVYVRRGADVDLNRLRAWGNGVGSDLAGTP